MADPALTKFVRPLLGMMSHQALVAKATKHYLTSISPASSHVAAEHQAGKAVEAAWEDERWKRLQDERKEKPRGEEKMAEKNPHCLCGCGKRTKGGTFAPGHDAKLRSKLMEKKIKGTKEQWAFFKGHGWKMPK